MATSTTVNFAVETRDLTRRYGRVAAVDHLNLQVSRGALFGFIGPNGAGKTTTLRMLAGLLEPSAGEVWIDGRRVDADLDVARRLIGYMPDFFGVYDDMLVWEYLDFFARCYGLPASRRQTMVSELLELVNLADKRDANVQALSRGMQQRLCLAHALVHDPQILLLDEPASGLDPRARVEMRELLKELAAMGKTIIVSSHILSELAEMCTQVGIIEKGKMVACGSMEDIRRQLQSNRVLRMRLLADEAAALELVRSVAPMLSQVNASLGEPMAVADSGRPGTTIEVELSGGDDAAALLLAQLVSRGARIADFREAGNELEELFLRLTEESKT
jgi:ABC-2 type transport system ATP-binding protein